MGLLTIIRKAKLKEQEVTILLLGLDNAGKSSVLCLLLHEDVSKISPTFGFDIRSTELCGKSCNLWDVGGQETIRHYWRNFFEEMDGLIWVVDSADLPRLELCRTQLVHVLQEERLQGIPVLIFANKQDVPGALSVREIAASLKLDELGSRDWEIHGCSAHTGVGIQHGVSWLVNRICHRLFPDVHKHEEAS